MVVTGSPNKPTYFNPEKRALLLASRGIDLQEIAEKIEQGDIRAIRSNTNYPHQWKLDIIINDYVCCVPIVEDEDKIFIKTARPDRKRNKDFTG